MTVKKGIKRTFSIIILIILMIVLALSVLYFNELKTLFSLKKLNDYSFYTMRYSGDYGFDEFLKVGAKNVAGYTADNLPQPRAFNSFLTLAAPYLPFDGMNECGLTMALLAVPYAQPPQEPDQITLNTTTAIRLVLDKAKDVGEAIALLNQYNFYFSGDVTCHYLISDISGKSAVVEFLDHDIKIIENTENSQVVTNYILYQGINVGEGGSEFERYAIASETLKSQACVLTEKQAMQVLSDCKIPDRTQWSIVYNMITKHADICIDERYDQPYAYDLDDL